MARLGTQGKLIITDENLDLRHKGLEGMVNGKAKKSKTIRKKDGVGFSGRKALGDITNKSIHPEALPRKKNLQKEELKVEEEKFLHDHKKCIESQKASMAAFNIELVLPGHGSTCTSEQTEVDLDSVHSYLEPAELSLSEFSDWLKPSTQWNSPPSSPLQWDSPLSSPFAWHDEAVEFVLKEEINV
ncbi:Protein PATRONUS 2 [Quillaja saponaria]|uniref:Protein PATRONUS 2 n=1 Tax=Quillaja saponaria TaxID=32244 RepID=A0AAD7PMU4_QUISA|nr:Protein PATRONUS 2 [Quillaja saponaria]